MQLKQYITEPIYDKWATDIAMPELDQICYTIKTEADGHNELGFPCVRLVLTVEEGGERDLRDTCEYLDKMEVTEL